MGQARRLARDRDSAHQALRPVAYLSRSLQVIHALWFERTLWEDSAQLMIARLRRDFLEEPNRLFWALAYVPRKRGYLRQLLAAFRTNPLHGSYPASPITREQQP